VNVSEQAPPRDDDSPLAFTMEGRNGTPPSSLVPFYWSPGWNSVQALYKYTEEPNGSLKGGDPGICLIELVIRMGSNIFTKIPRLLKPKQTNCSSYQFIIFSVRGAEFYSAALLVKGSKNQLFI